MTAVAAVVQDCDGDIVFGEGPGGQVGAGVGGADGDKEAGGLEAQGRAAGVGGGHAGDLLVLIEEAAGSVTASGDGVAVDEGDGGRLAVGELDGEAQAEARAGQPQLVLADLVEEARAVAQKDGNAGDRVPDHIAKAAQAGEGEADLVPVGVQRQVFGGADGEQALGGERDRAGVGDVELEALRRARAAGRAGRRLHATGRCGRRRS